VGRDDFENFSKKALKSLKKAVFWSFLGVFEAKIDLSKISAQKPTF
jgi:hypothetical protein